MMGNWWLGDLGSAVQVGAPVHSTTQWFSQKNLIRQPAEVRYDWYMLAVALAAEVHKADWKEKLLEDGHCLAFKLLAAVQEVQTQSLLDLLQEVLLKCSVPCVIHAKLRRIGKQIFYAIGVQMKADVSSTKTL